MLKNSVSLNWRWWHLNPHYNQNYSREQIETVLEKIKSCVRTGRFIIAQNENRRENKAFIDEYNINSEKQKRILLNIEVEDFCHSLQNTKTGFEYETLFVFAPQVKLFNADDIEETVDVYTKFNIIERSDGNQTVVISFHKRNRSIDYLFK